MIGNVLNHSGLQHTAIYARLNLSPVTRALEENSERILSTAPKPSTNIPTPPAPSRASKHFQRSSQAERTEWRG